MPSPVSLANRLITCPMGTQISCDTAAEAGMEVHPFVVNKQVFGGGGADAEHDLVVLHIIGRARGVCSFTHTAMYGVLPLSRHHSYSARIR